MNFDYSFAVARLSSVRFKTSILYRLQPNQFGSCVFVWVLDGGWPSVVWVRELFLKFGSVVWTFSGFFSVRADSVRSLFFFSNCYLYKIITEHGILMQIFFYKHTHAWLFVGLCVVFLNIEFWVAFDFLLVLSWWNGFSSRFTFDRFSLAVRFQF